MRRPTVNPQARKSLGRGDVSRGGRGWGRSAGAAGCGNESSGGSGGEGGDLDEFHGNRFGWNDRRSKVRRDLILPVRISGARSKAVAGACPERPPDSGRFSLPSAAGPVDEVVAQAVLSLLQVEDRLARFLPDPGVPVERPRGVVDRLVVDLRLPGTGLPGHVRVRGRHLAQPGWGWGGRGSRLWPLPAFRPPLHASPYWPRTWGATCFRSRFFRRNQLSPPLPLFPPCACATLTLA